MSAGEWRQLNAIRLAIRLAILCGTLRAVARVFETDFVLATDGKGDFDIVAQEFAFHFAFEQQVATVAYNQQLRHRTTVTDAAMPRAAILWVCRYETTLFLVFAAKVISIEIPAVYGFVHWS